MSQVQCPVSQFMVLLISLKVSLILETVESQALDWTNDVLVSLITVNINLCLTGLQIVESSAVQVQVQVTFFVLLPFSNIIVYGNETMKYAKVAH